MCAFIFTSQRRLAPNDYNYLSSNAPPLNIHFDLNLRKIAPENKIPQARFIVSLVSPSGDAIVATRADLFMMSTEWENYN
jgi:hypothetical protein